MSRRASQAWVTIPLAVLGGLTTACTAEAPLRDRLFEAINATTQATLVEVLVPRGEMEETIAVFNVPTYTHIGARDVVATIQAVQEVMPRFQPKVSGRGLLIQSVVDTGFQHPGVAVRWIGDDPNRVVELSGWRGPWSEEFCSLSTLTKFETPGSGSDFSRINECHPQLTQLSICSADAADGLDGLAALDPAEGILVLSPIEQLDNLAPLQGISRIGLALTQDSPQDRARVEALLPGTEVSFLGPQDTQGLAQSFAFQCQ
ncbi:MAG: hypothetical protein LBH68_01925 [Bifidobacteriaceae bacterium]|jgi:hypothetical protein|nr:hypothetical protein [Bifidobacteriaceae bacterium]